VKKPKAVIEAETALTAKAAEVAAAKDTLKRLEAEHSAAYVAVRQAQTEADESMPQCRMVRVRWRSGTEEFGAPYVIVRRTPSGMLVVRPVGSNSGSEHRFKWAEHARKYRQVAKGSFTSDTLELRDVPAEYMPTCQEA
jgi:hypothetical protein